MGKPPFEQERACSTVKADSQSQDRGSLPIPEWQCISVVAFMQTHRINSLIGRHVSQFEPPLSLALILEGERCDFSCSAACEAC